MTMCSDCANRSQVWGGLLALFGVAGVGAYTALYTEGVSAFTDDQLQTEVYEFHPKLYTITC